jgi:hypothetical protein
VQERFLRAAAKMDDDKMTLWSPDSPRINLSEPKEIRHWTYELRCSEAELRDAIENVGTSAAAVRLYLRFR